MYFRYFNSNPLISGRAKIYFALFLFLFLILVSQGESRAQGTILGHNLTSTTSTLGQGDILLGTYAAGYGVADELTVATSTWLDTSYSMPNLGLKYAWVSDSENSSVSLEGLYFKTYPYGDRLFDQESYFLRLTYGFEYFDLWNVYLSGGYQYFFNDKRAYSLRAVPQSEDPRTLSVSMLQVWNFHKQAAILIELGILGTNYAVPFQHYGASLNFRFNKWMIQLGFSQSVSRSAIDYEIDDDGRMYWSGTSKGRLQHQTVSITHPEVQIQYAIQ